MNLTLTPIAVVFAFIVVGYICHRKNWISEEQVRGVSLFAMYLALPCLILTSFLKVNLAQVLDLNIYLTYYVAIITAFACGLLAARLFLKTTPTTAGLFAMASCFSNLGFIGLPIVAMTWGDTGVAVIAVVISIHPAFIFSTTILTIEMSKKVSGEPSKSWYLPLLELFRNSIILSVILGGVLSYYQIQPPEGIVLFLNKMSGAAAPCALFCVGAFLARAKFENSRGIITAVPIKIILMPLVAYVMARFVLEMEPMTISILTFLAALPTGANVLILSHYYRKAEADISSIISAATLFSFLSLPIIIWLV